MKRKSLLFSILSTMCVSLIAGCGGSGNNGKLKIDVIPNYTEWGTVSGGGYYNQGDTLALKIRPNKNCSPSSIVFTNSNTSETKNIDISSKVEYPNEISQNVTVEAPGTYKVIYACSNNSYRVKYFLLNENNIPVEELYTEGVETPLKLDGKLSKYKEYTYTDENEEYVWYVKDSNDMLKSISASDLELSISAIFADQIAKLASDKSNNVKELNLYTKKEKQDAKTIVLTAIEKFKENKEFSLSTSTGILDIKNYNMGIAEEMEDSLEVIWKIKDLENDGNNYPQIHVHEGIYYENKYDTSLYSLGVSGFRLTEDEIKEVENGILSFVEIPTLDTEDKLKNSLVEFESLGEGEYITLEDGKSCNMYYTASLQDGTDNIKWEFCIANETIYKMKKTVNDNVEKEFNISYSEIVGGLVSELENMYLVSLYTNDTGPLNELLSESFKADEIGGKLKITSAFGDNIISVINGENSFLNFDYNRNNLLKDLLKEYSYEFVYNYTSDSCNGGIVYSGGSINRNMDICIRVNKDRTNIKLIKTLLEEGNYTISTSIQDEGQTYQVAEWTAEESINVFSVVQKPDLMDNNIWKMLQLLNDIMATPEDGEEWGYYNFKYDETTKVYSFYKTKENSDAKIADLQIKFKDEDETKVETITYFNGKNTYVNTFTYNAIIE